MGSPPALVSRRPRANQLSWGNCPWAMATNTARRASEASRSLVHVVADGEQARGLVVQETVFHLGKLAGLQGQALDGGDAVLGAGAALLDLPEQFAKPGPLGGGGVRRRVGELGRQCNAEPRQGAQGRDGIHLVQVAEPVRRLRQPAPGREKLQFLTGGSALPAQCPRPPGRFAPGCVAQPVAQIGSKGLGGSRQLLQQPAHRRERARRQVVGILAGILKRLLEPGQRGGRIFANHLGQDAQGVAQAMQPAGLQDRAVQ